MRDMIPTALIAVLAVPAAAQTERGPDGHMVGPQRGDVIEVRGEPAPACAKRADTSRPIGAGGTSSLRPATG
jgi:hypothetical protein